MMLMTHRGGWRVWRAWGSSVFAATHFNTPLRSLPITTPSSLHLALLHSNKRSYCTSSQTKEQTKTSKDPHSLLKRAEELLEKNKPKKASEYINAAAAIDPRDLSVKASCATLAFGFNLYSVACSHSDAVIAEDPENSDPKIFLISIMSHFELQKPRRVIDVATRLIQKIEYVPSYHAELAVCYAKRASSYIMMDKIDAAMKDFEKLEALPQVPKSHSLYNDIYDSKWVKLLALINLKQNEGICQKAFDILFRDTDLKREPQDTRLNANRALLFHKAVITENKTDEAVRRLTKEIINDKSVHPFWRSIATMTRRELTKKNLEPIQDAIELYNAIVLHRNVCTLLGIRQLTADILAAVPEVDKDKFLIALDDFADLLYFYRNDPNSGAVYQEKPYCYWAQLAVLCFTMQDMERAKKYSELGLQFTKDIQDEDKHTLHRILATTNFLQKDFENAVKYPAVIGTDKQHLLTLATSYVILGGQRNEEKAQKLLASCYEGPYSETIANAQMALLLRDKNKILAEDADLQELQDNWRSINAVGSPYFTNQESIEHANNLLNSPGFSKPIFGMYRGDTLNRRGGIHLEIKEFDKAIQYFQQVEEEYPILTSYNEMRATYLRARKMTELLDVLNKLMKLYTQPEIQDIYLLEIATAESELSNPEIAHAALMKCTDKTKESLSWLESMIDVCRQGGRQDETKELMQKLSSHPKADKAVGKMVLGTMLAEEGKTQDAIREFETIVDDPARGMTASLNLARLYDLNLHDHSKALQLYAKVVEQYPYDSHEGSASCLYKLGLNDLALEQINLCLKTETGKGNPWVYLVRGSIFTALSRYDEALEDLQRVLDYNGKYVPEAYFRRGQVYYYQGKNDAAKTDFKLANSLDRALGEEIQNFYTKMEAEQQQAAWERGTKEKQV